MPAVCNSHDMGKTGDMNVDVSEACQLEKV